MRRWAALVVLGLLSAACTSGGGFVARGRQGSWQRVRAPAFTATGTSFGVAGLVAPGDGYAGWAAVGGVEDPAAGRTTAVAWTSADGTRWSRSDLDQGGARASTAAAGARRQGRIVVVGTVTTAGGDRDGRVWMSADGATWEAVDSAALGGRGDQEVTSVAAGPLGFVAAGRDWDRPALWTSPDGRAWSRVATGSAGPFLAGEVVKGVAVGPAGAVAVGTIRTGSEIDGMAWFSADAVAWRTVPLGTAGFAAPAEQVVRSVTATAGGFVAVGDDTNGDRRIAVAWTSADGIVWQRQPPSPDMAEWPDSDSTGGVFAVAVAGSGPVVAVGGGTSLQLWTSADGQRWARDVGPTRRTGSDDGAQVATDGRALLVVTGGAGLWFRPAGDPWSDVAANAAVFPRLSGGFGIDTVVKTRGTLLAFGSAGGDNAVWTSADGRTWSRTSADTGLADRSIDDVTLVGDTLVAVGTAFVAGSDRSASAAWISSDAGATWRRVDAGNPALLVRPTTQFFGVTAGGPGVVAVGLSYDIHESIHAHAWYSADGQTWKRSPDPPAWTAPGDHVLGDACPLPGGGVVAFGTTTVKGDQDAWAWVTTDGVRWERSSVAPLGGPGWQRAVACASTPTGVLLAGESEGTGVLWSRSDGRTWSVVAGIEVPDGRLRGVAVDGDRVVVTGRDRDDLVAFTSADAGRTWKRWSSAMFGGFGLQIGVPVIVGDEVVVAGVDGVSGAVWIGPAP